MCRIDRENISRAKFFKNFTDRIQSQNQLEKIWSSCKSELAWNLSSSIYQIKSKMKNTRWQNLSGCVSACGSFGGLPVRVLSIPWRRLRSEERKKEGGRKIQRPLILVLRHGVAAELINSSRNQRQSSTDNAILQDFGARFGQRTGNHCSTVTKRGNTCVKISNLPRFIRSLNQLSTEFSQKIFQYFVLLVCETLVHVHQE